MLSFRTIEISTDEKETQGQGSLSGNVLMWGSYKLTEGPSFRGPLLPICGLFNDALRSSYTT
jgi:hypothetical protein